MQYCARYFFFFQKINVKANSAENGELLNTFEVSYPEHLGTPRVLDASCKTNKKSELVCRIVLTTENAAVVQLQSGKNLLTLTSTKSL